MFHLALFVLLLKLSNCRGDGGHQIDEYLKREHSLIKPYQGVGSGSSSHWDLMGSAMVMMQYVRLTPDVQSKQGAIWNRIPCYLRDWEMQVHFKVHGQGKKNLNGDGFAIWYTKERMQPGPVFGSKDMFAGLGVFVDTYPNEEKQQERIFPYIMAMVGNGTLGYDHERDGRPTELGGCTALVRNLNQDTFLVIRYVRRRLTVMIDIDGKSEWRDCLDIPGVRLPKGYYFGASSVTGDLSDNHDIISLKLYQLTVERSAEEEREDKEVFIPSVDNIPLLREDGVSQPMSGLALFFIILFSVLGAIVLSVIGVIVYQQWKENRRKRFY
ncbi:lectin, mannose-binding 2-like a isoform X2 [Polypterus senegalus]|uniref:lectin, mannose-binding 2-like a isoform X2 n=1 Tax=Polypterus senegalus TaxID=55291 RepID=UPI001964E7AA|nr:lectin, mannose-binding 2-like a isoform X2 [Polypterus senegalus]